MFLKNISFTVMLAAFSLPTLAGSTYVAPDWDFTSGQSEVGSISNNEILGEVDDIDITINAWSSSWYDEENYNHNGNNYGGCVQDNRWDQCIQRATLTHYSTGLGTINDDESGGEPHHAVDNSHQDYDMILLSFSEKVKLDNIYTGWNRRYYDNSSYVSGKAGASVLAYTGSNNIGSTPFSLTDTWASIIGSNSWKEIDSDTKSIGKNGSLDTLPVASGDLYSKFWLVGAAHSVQRDANLYTDFIKIAGIDFVKYTHPGNPGNPVSAPGALVLLLGSIALGLGRRKK